MDVKKKGAKPTRDEMTFRQPHASSRNNSHQVDSGVSMVVDGCSLQLPVSMMSKILNKTTTTVARALEQAWVTGCNTTFADL